MGDKLTDERLNEIIASSDELFPNERVALARELLASRRRLNTAIQLPNCNASPVCEIEAGYAAGVSDCREAIRRAGYPIEGDD